MEKFAAAPPAGVLELIKRLERGGFEAWAVGGCVRDALLGRAPHDWDLCTSATPQQMRACFAGLHLIDTGLRHGTLTARVDHCSYEVTTYRVDGAYQDGRRPAQVRFVRSLTQDLARRDFTVNAMAWHPQRGLADPYGGQTDLAARRIRCVGRPADRFEEDALRILRALRFAATLGFELEEQTARAVREERAALSRIAPERLREEFFRLLCGPGCAAVLDGYLDVFCVFLPELGPMRGCLQHNAYHDRDVWGHTLAALEAVPADDLTVRLAALLHDIGKPECFTQDENGVGHFYGHAARSVEIARAVLQRLRCDGETLRTVTGLVLQHDLPFSADPRLLRRRLAQLGPQRIEQLLALQRADVCGQAPGCRAERLAAQEEIKTALNAVLRQRPCLDLGQLAVDGRDVLALGVPQGPGVGALLRALLEQVVDGALPNERAALLAELRKKLLAEKDG